MEAINRVESAVNRANLFIENLCVEVMNVDTTSLPQQTMKWWTRIYWIFLIIIAHTVLATMIWMVFQKHSCNFTTTKNTLKVLQKKNYN